MKKQTSILLFFALLVSTTTLAQIGISGIVTDANGSPLPGVAVVEKGTSNGVTTDFDGNYSISNVDESATLIFSYLGFKTLEAGVRGQSTINISLDQDVTQLEDVVVVGYGTKKKAEVIGAVVQESGEELQRNPAANYATSLAGRLPGLVINQTSAEPGRENVDILIRGKGTFRDNAVLVVIDGVIGRDGLSRLDPQDIESISVLKDASAAIYGARAANGVILVTTKRGKIGKPQFNFSSNQAVTVPTRFVENASAYDYARQVNDIQAREGAVLPYSPAQLAEFQAPGFKSVNWWKEVYDRISYQNRYALSLRGGTEKSKYFLSMGTTQQDGVIKTDKSTNVKQYNFRSNIDVSVSENLQLALNLAGRKEERQWYGGSAFDVLQNTVRGLPMDMVYQDDMLLAPQNRNGINPLIYVQGDTGYNRQANTLFNGTLSLNYEVPGLSGLSVGVWGAADYNQNYHKSFTSPPTQYILESDGSLTPELIGSLDELTEAYYRKESLTFNTKIAFQRTFGDHSIDSFVSFEQNQTKDNSTNASREGGLLSSTTDVLSAGDVETEQTSVSSGSFARQGYLGRVTYDFDKKYFAQFHFRYDGSFNFPEGKRWGFFPGAQVGWRISQENFLKNSKTISNLKLRGTWGLLGNDRVAAFQYLSRFGPDGTFPIGGGNVPVLSPLGKDPNPNITWETAESINLGLDAAFFDNKVSFELDIFKEKRDDILASRNVSIPNFTGLNLPDENIGKTENKGFEVSLGYRTLGKVGFNVNANMAYSKNKLVFQDAVPPNEEYQDLEGSSIGSRLIYNAIGIYRSQADLDTYPGVQNVGLGDLIYDDTNGDGELTPDDRIVFEGTKTPEIQFGLSLGANYKGFEINTLIQGQANAYLETRAIFDRSSDTGNAPAYFLSNAYTPDTPDAILPRIGTSDQHNGYVGGTYASTFWQRDASFVRLKTVELAYTLPKNVTTRFGIDHIRLLLSGTNLLTFDGFKKDGLADPEQSNELGWSIPHQKIFNFGLNITF